MTNVFTTLAKNVTKQVLAFAYKSCNR